MGSRGGVPCCVLGTPCPWGLRADAVPLPCGPLQAKIQAIIAGAKEASKAEAESVEGGGPMVGTAQRLTPHSTQGRPCRLEVLPCSGLSRRRYCAQGLPLTAQYLRVRRSRSRTLPPLWRSGRASPSRRQAAGMLLCLPRLRPAACGTAVWRCKVHPALTRACGPQVSSDETERLIKMEEVLHGRVIGQVRGQRRGGPVSGVAVDAVASPPHPHHRPLHLLHRRRPCPPSAAPFAAHAWASRTPTAPSRPSSSPGQRVRLAAHERPQLSSAARIASGGRGT
jgi:hypothetical protein